MQFKALSALSLIVSLSATSVFASGGSGSTPDYDVNKPAWFQSHIVQAYAVIPTPGSGVAPSDDRPDVTAYLVGHIFDVTPFGTEEVVDQLPPDFPLPFITVPAHDDVFPEFNTAYDPVDAFGFWVIPGPAADTDEGATQNVKVRPEPLNSAAGAPLAYSIKLGGQWRLLTSTGVIETGLEVGLLQAVPSGPDGGFGGYGWLDVPVKH